MSEIDHIGQLKPDPRNARKHNARNIGMIRQALGEVGAARSIVIDEDGTILAGNGVIEAAADAGIERVQVVDADGETIVAVRRKGLTPEQKTKLALFDNRTAELAEWDPVVLSDIGVDLGDLFTDVELDKLGVDLGEPTPGPGAQMDRAEELQAKWNVLRGQVWEIGKHRLMCGDSTSAEDVAVLMAGKMAALFATDPPYGVAYGDLIADDLNRTKHWDRIVNDNLCDEKLQSFLEAAFRAWLPALNEDAAWYLWHAQKTQGYFTAAAAAAAAGVIYHRQIVWVKPRLILGRGHYHWRHELCLYGWRKGHEPAFCGGHDKTTVWEFDAPGIEREHPTQKPTECFTWPMRFSTAVGALCAEPFSGSGTQFIAAEQTGRICYGMEIEPKYCAVTLERLAGMGLEPRLLDA